MSRRTAVKEKIETAIAPEAPAAQLPAVHQPAPPPQPRTPPEAKAYPPHIAKAVVSIMRDMSRILKKGKHEFHKYSYVRWEELNEELQPLLIEHGLMITQSEIGHSLIDPNDKGSMMAIEYEFTIINEDGEMSPPTRVTATGRLRDQKGIMDDRCAAKCHTQALKQFYSKLFKIRTDDAIEARPHLLTKDARSLFVRLQRSLSEATGLEGIEKWVAENKERVELLPNSMQDQLRVLYKARTLDPNAPAPHPDDLMLDNEKYSRAAGNALHAHDPETGEVADRVVWEDEGERPATADDFEHR